jgi:hypothetical protein
MAIATLVVLQRAALAASSSGARRLETSEHRYYDDANRLHIDIRIRHIPLHLRDGTTRPTARGGGRRSHSRAREQSVETQAVAPAAEPGDVQPESAAPGVDPAPGIFTAPGYGPPLPTAAHPILPMPMAP